MRVRLPSVAPLKGKFVDFWQHLLQSYDQPMIVLGVVGGLVSTGMLFQTSDQRDTYSPDDIRYQIAYKRTKWLVLSLLGSASLFATGWAVPNPDPTVKSLYEDCMWEPNRTRKDCLVIAKTLYKEFAPKEIDNKKYQVVYYNIGKTPGWQDHWDGIEVTKPSGELNPTKLRHH
jgi:hypothetical protein